MLHICPPSNHHYNKYLSQPSNKACILELKKSMSNVCSQEVTARFNVCHFYKSLASQLLLKESKNMYNTWPSIADRTCECVWRYGWQVMDRAHWSTDYGPTDFHPFGFVLKHVTGKRLATEAEVKQAATSQLPVLDIDFFYPEIQSLAARGVQTLKYGWWIRGFMICTISYPCTLHILK